MPVRPTIASFAPVVGAGARALVLGSMPGDASLAASEYYAHPRNVFWPLMGALVGAHPDLPYAQRLARLNAAGVALWDVLAECTRPGSLDSAIRNARHNDIDALLHAHPGIGHVLFNGAKAESEFRRMPQHDAILARGVRLLRLPSTSPANAGTPRDAKCAAWREAFFDAGIAVDAAVTTSA